MRKLGVFVAVSALLITGCSASDTAQWHPNNDLHYATYHASSDDAKFDSAWSGKLVRIGNCVGVEENGWYLIEIPDSYELVTNDSGQFALRHGSEVYPFDREYTGGGVLRENLDKLAGHPELQKCAADHAVAGSILIYTIEK
ncbi:hypothetical protein BSZ39_12285 [Bowdeniella nasicola]|uniref:Lipoprotein n=1 Tax=Bowdeniella nasicola TaxID=208480 RepID=A0A1Q5PZY9_9ACTO|nr:hypothetical protein [Bowdeniella nasicola]OKL52930.1 hypothetical protein BSZ39_12285 [Bowdeniella nasicola]